MTTLDTKALEAAYAAGEVSFAKAYDAAPVGSGVAIAEEYGWQAAVKDGITAYIDALSSLPAQAVGVKLDRSPQHMQGYRHAAKAAVEWLHRRAAEMNDPNAKAILNTAAFNLGTDLARGKAALRSTP